MFEDEFEEYDRSSHRRAKYVKNKKQQYKKLLDSVSVDVYRDKFNNDHLAYWEWVFRFDDEPKPYVKPEPIKVLHPFEKWL